MTPQLALARSAAALPPCGSAGSSPRAADVGLADGADKHYVIVSTHLEGHLRPALCVAQALQAQLRAAGRGGTVRFAAMQRAREQVLEAGVPFVDLGGAPAAGAGGGGGGGGLAKRSHTSGLRRPGSLGSLSQLMSLLPGPGGAHGGAMASALAAMEAAMLPRLLDALIGGDGAPAADVLVADTYALAARAAAEKLALPLALLWAAAPDASLANAGCLFDTSQWLAPSASVPRLIHVFNCIRELVR